jgi:hypothetical protein
LSEQANATSPAPVALEYVTPTKKPPLSGDQRAIIKRIALMGIVVALAIAYCQIGIRITQRRLGTDVLFEPATGTKLYDNLFIDAPCVAVLGTLAIISLSGAFPLRRASIPIVILLLLLSVAGFFVFGFAMFGLWDEISP